MGAGPGYASDPGWVTSPLRTSGYSPVKQAHSEACSRRTPCSRGLRVEARARQLRGVGGDTCGFLPRSKVGREVRWGSLPASVCWPWRGWGEKGKGGSCHQSQRVVSEGPLAEDDLRDERRCQSWEIWVKESRTRSLRDNQRARTGVEGQGGMGGALWGRGRIMAQRG